MTKLAKNKKRGFTLIELIVVIAILAILAAILVPTMIGVVNDSKTSVATTNARLIYGTAKAYAANKTLKGETITADSLKTLVEADLGELNGDFTITLGGDTVASVTFTPTGGEAVTYPTDATPAATTATP